MKYVATLCYRKLLFEMPFLFTQHDSLEKLFFTIRACFYKWFHSICSQGESNRQPKWLRCTNKMAKDHSLQHQPCIISCLSLGLKMFESHKGRNSSKMQYPFFTTYLSSAESWQAGIYLQAMGRVHPQQMGSLSQGIHTCTHIKTDILKDLC